MLGPGVSEVTEFHRQALPENKQKALPPPQQRPLGRPVSLKGDFTWGLS